MRFLRPSWSHGSFSSEGCDKKQLMDWPYAPFDLPVEEKPSEWLHFAWVFLLQHVISYQKCEHSPLSFQTKLSLDKLNLECIVNWL